ncbi:hypothetical protein TCAL_05960 [Tigriopus californicus]|uniref:Ubiquitin-like domain-containing protein n=1 Tax=Tigriopus californicus TaxID=6832 RepID=A0A553NPY9_TIGCA|nr:hypothetical protein TCAL_05960 [Tigriopus californicus]|eukprot:TCALIF_05960-PA protein Name:"Similar to SUMO3 Small ubiquitin-related modifier 3 (Gallus gallus)" AED:0.07 eAED:0.07 QI:0/-1/0/1/-1/1/1/0/113
MDKKSDFSVLLNLDDCVKAESDPKPVIPQLKKESDKVRLSVAMDGGPRIEFKTKTSNPLKKIMTTYCREAKVNVEDVRFFMDGQRLKFLDTPEEAALTDGDVIEVYPEQDGGL